jgi:hypothetical protein
MLILFIGYHIAHIVMLHLSGGMCVLFDRMVSHYADNYVVTLRWNVCTV